MRVTKAEAIMAGVKPSGFPFSISTDPSESKATRRSAEPIQAAACSALLGPRGHCCEESEAIFLECGPNLKIYATCMRGKGVTWMQTGMPCAASFASFLIARRPSHWSSTYQGKGTTLPLSCVLPYAEGNDTTMGLFLCGWLYPRARKSSVPSAGGET